MGASRSYTPSSKTRIEASHTRAERWSGGEVETSAARVHTTSTDRVAAHSSSEPLGFEQTIIRHTLVILANRAVHRDLWRKWFITHARIVRSVSPRCPTRTAIPVSAFRRPTESRMAPKLKPGHAKRRSTSPITATYSYDDPAPPNSAISPQACSFDTSACAAVTGATPLADSPAAAPVVRPPSAAAALKDPAVPRPAGTQSPCRAD